MSVVFLPSPGSSSYGDIFTSLSSRLWLTLTSIGQSTLFCSLSLSRKSQLQKVLHRLCAIVGMYVFVCISGQKNGEALVIVRHKPHTQEEIGVNAQHTLYF